MKVEIKIDKECSGTKVIIITDKITKEVDKIVETVSNINADFLVGYNNEKAYILNEEDVFKIYSCDNKIYAQTEKEEYILKTKLYKLEEELNKNLFIRISKSEIINFKKINHLDLSFSGTICITFKNGKKAYTSRRYINKIKDKLNI